MIAATVLALTNFLESSSRIAHIVAPACSQTQRARQKNSLIVLPLLLCLGPGRRRGSATLRQPRKRKVYQYCSYARRQLRFEIKRLVTLSEAL